jgi:hypothetical protein
VKGKTEMRSMTLDELRKVCFAFEEEHGMEGFCDAMADIMAERMALKGSVFGDELSPVQRHDARRSPPDAYKN